MASAKEELEQLHVRLTGVLNELLDSGDYSKGTLAEVRQFLRDNNISAPADSKPMLQLMDKVPYKDDEELHKAEEA